MFTDLEKSLAKVVGTKQTLKELQLERVKKVFIAQDAEEPLKDAVRSLAQKMETDIVYVETMEELGLACQIDVGAACAAILEE